MNCLRKFPTWEHKQNLSHHQLFWTFLLCCFLLHNNFAIEWFSAAPDFLLVASLCLEMLGQSYQEHGFVYVCWGMLMIWCYTSTHGLPKDQLIWISLRRSILFPSQHSLKVFTFSFSGFTLDFMPGLFIAHNTIKVIKKINRNKNCKQTKYLENLNYESVWVVSVIKRRYQIKVASLFILKSTSN